VRLSGILASACSVPSFKLNSRSTEQEVVSCRCDHPVTAPCANLRRCSRMIHCIVAGDVPVRWPSMPSDRLQGRQRSGAGLGARASLPALFCGCHQWVERSLGSGRVMRSRSASQLQVLGFCLRDASLGGSWLKTVWRTMVPPGRSDLDSCGYWLVIRSVIEGHPRERGTPDQLPNSAAFRHMTLEYRLGRDPRISPG